MVDKSKKKKQANTSAPAPKDQGEPDDGFNAGSTRFCESCKRDVQIGLGGEANWQQHIKSAKHRSKAPVPAARGIKNFFTRAISSVKPTGSSSSTATGLASQTHNASSDVHQPSHSTVQPLGPGTNTQSTTIPHSQTLVPVPSAGTELRPIDLDADVLDNTVRPAGANQPLWLVLATKIRFADTQLPPAVPLGLLSDAFAEITGDPTEGVANVEEAWEEDWSRSLHRVLGYNSSVADLVRFVRRGRAGLEGFGDWVEAIGRAGIDVGMLTERVEKLLAAVRIVLEQHGLELRYPDPAGHQESTDLDDMPPPLEPITIVRKHSTSAYAAPMDLDDIPPPLEYVTDLDDIPPPLEPIPSQGSKPVTPAPILFTCLGYRMTFPDGSSPYLSYPFAIHDIRALPWNVAIVNPGPHMYLRSVDCAGQSTRPTCASCRKIENHSIVMGIRHRNLDGAHKNTPWAYLSITQLFDWLKQKTSQIDALHLDGLNRGRLIAVRVRHLDGWRRLVMSIINNEIPRIRIALAVQERNGAGVFGYLRAIDAAAKQAYKPKSYQEADFQRSYLIWKLGGVSAANIAHRTLGTPSIDSTRRNMTVNHIRASSGFPSVEDLLSNLCAAFEDWVPMTAATGPPGHIVVYGASVSSDELKIQERLRWEAFLNTILGLCREHSSGLCLDFRSLRQADVVLEALKAVPQRVHFASEATVMALSILTNRPQDYVARPFLISGTCKRETVTQHRRLVQSALTAIAAPTSPIPRNVRIYVISTDGDSRRRQVLIDQTMNKEFPLQSAVFRAFELFDLFSRVCGEDEITNDADWKHVFKRLRNTLLRQSGITIDDISLSSDIIKAHLVESQRMAADAAQRLLAPNDRQDVTLMIQLLNSVSHLPPPNDRLSPPSQASRRILNLLGSLYRYLLESYLDVTLSLDEQLTRLSAASHLALALYNQDKGRFIPVQLYFDLQSMIRTVYICVAKAQVDNPDGQFFIILLGTDGLEQVFGKVRTMVGSDCNADMLQLANRIDGAVQCVKILELHPEWGGQARRLNLTSLKEMGEEITAALDHISPRSWKGDVSYRDLVLFTCWSEGERLAAGVLREAGLEVPFGWMKETGGYDNLCPFGGGKIVLKNGLLSDEEQQEEEEGEEGSTVAPPSDGEVETGDVSIDEVNAGGIELPDLDDLADADAAIHPDTGRPRYEPRVVVDPSNPKGLHKASILRLYSNPLVTPISKDRLTRVRDSQQFDQPDLSPAVRAALAVPEDKVLAVEDPALTLVRCDNLFFVAVVSVLQIQHNHTTVSLLPSSLVNQPNVRVRARIMTLVCTDRSHQSAHPDWQWNGRFESGNDLRDLEGTLLLLIDPDTERGVYPGSNGNETYSFKSSELRAMGQLLFSRTKEVRHRICNVRLSDTFPYRLPDGSACFICEDEDVDRYSQHHGVCYRCDNRYTAGLSGPRIIEHEGAHILSDPLFKGSSQVCGLCLGTGSSCVIFLRQSKKGTSQVNMTTSRCPNLYKIVMKKAAKSTVRSPCSNVPLKCPLCIAPNSPAVWKYNLKFHIENDHPGANAETYRDLYEISESEETLMKGVWLNRKAVRVSAKMKRLAQRPQMKISDTHSTRLALLENADGDALRTANLNDNDVYAHITARDSVHNAQLDVDVVDAEGQESGDEELDHEGTSSESDNETTDDDSDPGEATITDAYVDDQGIVECSDDLEDGLARIMDDTSLASERPPSPSAPPHSHCQLEGPEGQSTETMASIDPEVVHGEPSSTQMASSRPVRQSARKRLRIESDEEKECYDPNCSTSLNEGPVVRCDGPSCSSVYHLKCAGLLQVPQGGWFCDTDCQVNAGFRVGKSKRRRPAYE
ncbi:uncharacterized protein STEHIDRAFT_121332 [Stereum hirsutum FP-91666 SS1]|uniref:uncharacterized protein n=1 Tax=Stereum hirsutum (strain FP-91666) TaxID=721885 RepID=UPI000440A16E|nr:uncharacterized protein STEHIDRAFT_121332 [Stereum hirsutum FP-91666 SS1]EIM87715.1 hypothetical protein STEHIDRAFT_121332 [Stereum hirsutum FP-91666 SS1]